MTAVAAVGIEGSSERFAAAAAGLWSVAADHERPVRVEREVVVDLDWQVWLSSPGDWLELELLFLAVLGRPLIA